MIYDRAALRDEALMTLRRKPRATMRQHAGERVRGVSPDSVSRNPGWNRHLAGAGPATVNQSRKDGER